MRFARMPAPEKLSLWAYLHLERRFLIESFADHFAKRFAIRCFGCGKIGRSCFPKKVRAMAWTRAGISWEPTQRVWGSRWPRRIARPWKPPRTGRRRPWMTLRTLPVVICFGWPKVAHRPVVIDPLWLMENALMGRLELEPLPFPGQISGQRRGWPDRCQADFPGRRSAGRQGHGPAVSAQSTLASAQSPFEVQKRWGYELVICWGSSREQRGQVLAIFEAFV